MSAEVISRRRRVRRIACWSLGSLVGLLVLGNATIVGLSFWARSTTPTTQLGLAGINNGVMVDQHLWRGAAPTAEGYRNLAAAGVTTIVDLRNPDEVHVPTDELADIGVELVNLPIRDGQLPSKDDIAAFLAVVRESEGTVFLHCGAGVGRTGALVAAYEAAVGGMSGPGAARANLAVGPPSLEQIAFAASGGDRPPVVVSALSRVLDAPRRIWHNL